MADEETRRGDGGSTPEAEDKPGRDFFYHGTIRKLFPKNNAGVVRTSSGREIPFSYQLIDLIGPVRKPQELREGLVVGFDMSWTSDGLKVTKIKTYRRTAGDQANSSGATEQDAAEDSQRK